MGDFSGRYNDIKKKGSGGSEQDILFLVSEHTNLIISLVFERKVVGNKKRLCRSQKPD